MEHRIQHYMNLALSLAERGRGKVLPNPMVGALIVKDNKLIGSGWHKEYGGIHAEDACIQNCIRGKQFPNNQFPQNAILFCTLEPCCYRSSTKHNSPCTERIIAAGIRKVYLGRLDPNPAVRGKGIAALRKAGIEVETGIREEEEAELNRVYECIVLKKRPYVHLKVALSMDGYLAASDGSAHWISCEASRMRVMELRAQYHAVLVGAGTVKMDRPRLSVRNLDGSIASGLQPLRIVLKGKTPIPEEWLSIQRKSGEILIIEADKTPLNVILANLLERKIYSVLVEGGSGIFTSFLKTGLWDRLTVFQAPDLLGNGISFYKDSRNKNIKQKIILQNRQTQLCDRDVEITGDKEKYPCLQV